MGVIKYDLSGKKFSLWTVIKRAPNGTNGEVRWLCKCDCGTVKTVAGRGIRLGTSKSCGCGWIKDITGKRFGKLTAIRRTTERGISEWFCECDCGGATFVNVSRLENGHIKSCGCTNRGRPGRYVSKTGYAFLSGKYDHKNANKGCIKEHRYIMSQVFGRPLRKNETVHHINGIRSDNRPENLELRLQGSHPSGTGVKDLIIYAEKILKEYKPEVIECYRREMLSLIGCLN